jgi:hypothetical protein
MGRCTSGSLPTYPAVMKQPERAVEPVLTALLPPEPMESLSAHQMPLDTEVGITLSALRIAQNSIFWV